MRILMYKGQSGYDALRVFTDELSANLNKLGHEIRVLDFKEQGAIDELMEIYRHKPDNNACHGEASGSDVNSRERIFFPDVIFSMNGIEVDLRTPEGRLLHNEMGVPFVSYIVDHPLYHHERLKTRLRDHYVICVNEGFAEYVKTYYKVKEAYILMQGGIEAGEDKAKMQGGTGNTEAEMKKHRLYDVVFIGTYRGEKEIEAKIEASDPTVRNVCYCMLEELINNPAMRLEEGLMCGLKKQGISLKPAVFADTMNAMHLSDKYVRAMYRKLAVKSLLQNGIPVDVWGDNWEKLKPELTNPSLLTVHEPVSYREAADIYGNAKVVLNVMPWAKEGLHDRILTSMLAGAVCVSDETTTLVERLAGAKGNKNSDKASGADNSGMEGAAPCVLYSLAHLEKLPGKVKEILNNPGRMKNISMAGYQMAKSGHTWEERAKELDGILNLIMSPDHRVERDNI